LTFEILRASTLEQVAASRALFEEYAAWTGLDLSFQGFDAELATLPGVYAPPRGRLLLAQSDNGFAGCIALRPLEAGTCEMKRLYVRPAFRGQGVAKRLTEQVLTEGRTIGYRKMKLDTLPFMEGAIGLYKALGFLPCAAYYPTPLTDTLFLERDL
jgi:putative acetyltransferase